MDAIHGFSDQVYGILILEEDRGYFEERMLVTWI